MSNYELSLILSIEQRLAFPALSLVRSIAFETGGTFSPSIKNKNSGATGLIQFLESTAEKLEKGLYKRLPSMSIAEQLVYVEKYFLQWQKVFKEKPKEAFDVYALMLHPPLYNKPDSTVFGSSGSKIYEGNKGFDTDKSGVITKGEIKKKWEAATGKLLNSSKIPITTVKTNSFIAMSIAIFLCAMYYVLKMPR
ncbi:MAG: hypothetical protein J7623_21165 [Chitinophaga sp.]|uniref:hypothetical protein n=1 Tax=Chitinophaga sp. TaxID=1869181 RepID=UPI001B155759|nr:hypothetical protein [Chitinophaga sp.]MBO9731162.1 hypothetical protein [Chitinophaga sp.]